MSDGVASKKSRKINLVDAKGHVLRQKIASPFKADTGKQKMEGNVFTRNLHPKIPSPSIRSKSIKNRASDWGVGILRLNNLISAMNKAASDNNGQSDAHRRRSSRLVRREKGRVAVPRRCPAE